MATEKGLNLLTEITLEKMRAMADTGMVIGDPIQLPNGVTAVPVSRVAVGFGAGGSDNGRNVQTDAFGGGLGGGVTITPIAFLVTQGDGVKILQLDTIGSTADNLIRSIPEVMDKLADMIGGRRNKKEN